MCYLLNILLHSFLFQKLCTYCRSFTKLNAPEFWFNLCHKLTYMLCTIFILCLGVRSQLKSTLKSTINPHQLINCSKKKFCDVSASISEVRPLSFQIATSFVVAGFFHNNYICGSFLRFRPTAPTRMPPMD